jgi:hypothetical protein
MMFLLGLGLTVIGSVDVGLLFVPARWASLDWEFGTVSAFIDGLPLMTMGFGAMVVASTGRGWWKWRVALAAAALLMTVVVLAMVVIFVLDVPAALRAVSPVMRSTLTKAVLKTGIMGLVYVGIYATLGVWTWRRLKSLKGASQ